MEHACTDSMYGMSRDVLCVCVREVQARREKRKCRRYTCHMLLEGGSFPEAWEGKPPSSPSLSVFKRHVRNSHTHMLREGAVLVSPALPLFSLGKEVSSHGVFQVRALPLTLRQGTKARHREVGFCLPSQGTDV